MSIREELDQALEKNARRCIELFDGASCACAPVKAQKSKHMVRLGFLVPGGQAAFATRVDAFRQGLRDFGYIEGGNILIEYRYAEHGFSPLPELAAELVQLKVDIIVTAGTGLAPAKKATSSIPIVFAAATDPVGARVIETLARPGGNVTGLTNFSEDLDAKRLELLKETVPKMSRVAHLWNTNSPKSEVYLAAQALNLKLRSAKVGALHDFNGAFN